MEDSRRSRFEQEALVHLSAVFNAAWRLARSEDSARDLTQETMLRAYRTFDGFTPGTNARAWLLTIVYSTFVNQYHHRRRRPVHVSLDEIDTSALPSTTNDVNPFSGTWTDTEVTAALDELPDLFRETVLLVDVEELTYEEAARAQGCAVGTVRSRLFRGRRLLASALDAYATRHGLKPAASESL